MPNKQTKPTPENLAYRQLSVRAMTDADKESGAIPVIVATEEPVRVYDKAHRKVVNEILLMAGAELPKQAPMVDDHDGGSKAVVGSLRGFGISGDELHAYAHFSSKRAAQEMKQDVLDGHITDLSVGAERLEETYIDTGKEAVVMGRKFQGPARIVTRWRPFHGAVVDSGADKRSVFTPRAYSDPETLLEEAMNATYREHLESLGMPKEHSDEQALDWAKENVMRKQDKVEVVVTPAVDEDAIKRAAGEEAAKSERQRVKDIRASVRGAQIEEAFADSLIDNGVSKSDAAQAILDELSKRNRAHGRGADVVAVGSEADSFRAAALDGFSQRMGWSAPAEHKVAKGASEIRSMRFLDLCRKALEVEGESTRAMSDRDVVARAFRINTTMRASDGQAYLTTGNFANLLLDAQNKTLLKAFQEAESSYQRWVRIAPSVADFKTIYRTRLSEIGWQPIVPENDEYKDMSLSDSKESYRIEKRGSLISLSWETMVNDDLGAFARLVQLQGAAMRRTINQSVYQLLFDNPTMSDTGALFNSTAITTAGGHNNTVASDASVAVYNTMFKNMALQKGLNSDVLLGLRPKYIITSAGELATHWQIMNSVADPAAGGSAAGNSNTRNIYGPGGSRSLEIIEEPLIDGNDADQWYAACDTSLIDTIEVCFLQGEEQPVFEQESAFTSDSIKYKVRQTWGVGAIEWRGLYRSTGG